MIRGRAFFIWLVLFYAAAMISIMFLVIVHINDHKEEVIQIRTECYKHQIDSLIKELNRARK